MTSGVKEDTSLPWTWKATGKAFDYKGWLPDEPNYLPKKVKVWMCMYTNTQGYGIAWNDEPISVKYFPICEFPNPRG